MSPRITPADAGKTCGTGLRGMQLRDHPRGCGENCFHFASCFTRPGSPPRMRGKQLVPDPDAVGTGITPADAGKTSGLTRSTVLPRDHPRGCGENPAKSLQVCDAQGSPPRMRGKRTDISLGVTATGITPADAGKTLILYLYALDSSDHPRGCGENIINGNSDYNIEGSPPRMRGKLRRCLGTNPCKGITPADAGKTLSLAQLIRTSGDHPRGCGENQYHQPLLLLCVGSPPRMRGKLPSGCGSAVSVRITPADAGKTVPVFGHCENHRDHPRGCGENISLSVHWIAQRGSPPRMRGKHGAIGHEGDQGRITPADAGKTRCTHQIMCGYWDHPRGCGENEISFP